MTKKLIPTEGCDDCEFWRIETDGEITVVMNAPLNKLARLSSTTMTVSPRGSKNGKILANVTLTNMGVSKCFGTF